MSNEYSRPYNPDGVLAYFISFRCYGTWLHGDERGSMDRKKCNVYGESFLPTDPIREKGEFKSLKHPPVTLNKTCRQIVIQTIRDVCIHQGWALHALNVQKDHVHLVLTANQIKPEYVMTSLKSWATGRLRATQAMSRAIKPWSRHGSTKWLWTDEQVEQACAYVFDGQCNQREE